MLCVGCQPHIEVQKSTKNSKVKVIASGTITENTDYGIITVDNVEYIVICKRNADGGVAIIKHEKPNKAEVE